MSLRHMKSPLWRYGFIFVASIVPLFIVAWILLKSAEDSLIAEKVRADLQAEQLLKLSAEKAEKTISEANEIFRETVTSKKWYENLTKDKRIGAIRWKKPEDVSLQSRSREVSAWLLDVENKQSELREWIEQSRFEYSPSFILFVLRESGLAEEYPLIDDQVSWSLDSDDKRGVQLSDQVSILWNFNALPSLGGDYEWVKENYDAGVAGLGEDIGIISLQKETTSNHDGFKQVLMFFCLVWILLLLVFLIYYSRKKERLAIESLDQISTVAHEIRTPLTGMKLMLERIKNTESDLPFIDQVEVERQRLEDMMEQFLVQGKLRQNIIQLQLVDWQKWLVDEHARTLTVVKTSVELNLELSSSHGSNAYLDQSLMGIVFSNIIKNSIQYGGDSFITIKEIVLRDSVGFEIIDQGQGIDAELLKRVFRKYERGEMSYSRNSEGMGLGLSIAKEIVTLHEGEIEVSSEVGQGSVVRVTLPKETNV